MKIRSYKKIDNNKFYVKIVVEDFSQEDLGRMAKYGDPDINVGGNYGRVLNPGEINYTLPQSFEGLKMSFSDPGYTTSFDGADYPDAETRADAWAQTIGERIIASIGQLRTKPDTFTEELVQNV